jgi:hypothetical protein
LTPVCRWRRPFGGGLAGGGNLGSKLAAQRFLLLADVREGALGQPDEVH